MYLDARRKNDDPHLMRLAMSSILTIFPITVPY